MLRARHLIFVALLVCLAFCRARAVDIYDCYNGSSEQGGHRLTTNGIQSAQYAQQSYPAAQVDVFLHNSSTHASIFQDAAGTIPLANPFSSSSHGVAFWCGPDGHYDVQYSLATIPVPFTVSDIHLCFACAGGGGGGGLNPGTPFQVTRYDPTGANIQDSRGSDNPANGPTQWPAGLNVIADAAYEQKITGIGGSVANEIVDLDSSGNVVVSSTSSTVVFGIANGTVAQGGSVPIARFGQHSVLVDNQTAVNDYACPSATVAGEVHDAGATQPTNCEIVGRFSSVNTGAGTLAKIELPSALSVTQGASGTTNIAPCVVGTNFNLAYPNSGTNIFPDLSVTDDCAGNMTMKSLGLTDNTKAGFFYDVQGTAPSISVPNAVYYFPPTSVPTSYAVQPPGSIPSNGDCVKWLVTASVAQWADAGAPCGTGTGQVIQVNGTNLLTESPANVQNSNVTNGLQVTATNPSAGNIQLGITGPLPTFSQVPQPPAPTLTTNGTPGSTTISYCVVARQDASSSAGVYHTQCSATATITTANATLSNTNSVNLKSYFLTTQATSVRCFDIYRTATNGTSPTTTGLIAACADPASFIDTGLAGDATTAPATNVTVLLSHPQPQPACNQAFGGVFGIDAPNCAEDAFTDELAYTFQIAGVNSPHWTWANQASCTATLSNGMLQIQCPTNGGSDNLACLVETAPTPPYTFAAWLDFSVVQPSTSTAREGIAFRESATGKTLMIDYLTNANNSPANARIQIDQFTNTTTSTSPTSTALATQILNGQYFQLKNLGSGANALTLSSSPDGVFYTAQNSQTLTNFFTTAPDQVAICMSSLTSQNQMGVDYFRKTQ